MLRQLHDYNSGLVLTSESLALVSDGSCLMFICLGQSHDYNPCLVFASDSFALVSNGSC